jgi:hypothetical protein
MDPNLFHVDWERTGEALMLIIILAFLVERALAIVFESRIWLRKFDKSGAKEIIAAAVSIWVCFQWKFDALGMIILTETTTVPGYVITGLVIAGGSKASIKLFHDVLGMKSSALEEHEAVQAATSTANVAKAVAEQTAASNPGAAVVVTATEKTP